MISLSWTDFDAVFFIWQSASSLVLNYVWSKSIQWHKYQLFTKMMQHIFGPWLHTSIFVNHNEYVVVFFNVVQFYFLVKTHKIYQISDEHLNRSLNYLINNQNHGLSFCLLQTCPLVAIFNLCCHLWKRFDTINERKMVNDLETLGQTFQT